MASNNITALTNLATPQPTMLLYAGLSPFGATDDRKITANALFATITANISDVSVQFDDGAAAATVSAAGKGKLRYNDTTKTFQVSADGAAYADIVSGSSKWNALSNPDGNLSLSMASFTTTFTWGAATGAAQLFTITNTTDDTGPNSYLLAVETPGGSNQKRPFKIAARGNTVFHVLANGSVSSPGGGSSSERIGFDALSGGTDSVAFGNQANASGFAAIAIGAAAAAGAGGQHAVAIGRGASAGHQPSICIGSGATSTANGQFVVGDDENSNTRLTDFYFGSGVTDTSPNAITFNATGESGADQSAAGVDFRIAGAKGTGTGLGGSVRLQTAVVGSSGSSLNSLVDRYYVNGARKTLTDAATDLFEVALPTLKGFSCIVSYEIFATDGTDAQVRHGMVRIAAVNKAGAYTTDVAVIDEGVAASAGTLTATFAATGGADKVTISVTPAGSLTETTYYLLYQIANNSEQAITIL